MKLKEKELKIINHYGVMPQLKHFQSEIFELNEAIIQYEIMKKVDKLSKYIPMGYSHIIEEIADVQMMLNQLKEFYSISEISIDVVMNEKANRQIERIKNNE